MYKDRGERNISMKFLKQNSYDIVKLFVNQIGIAIFSMALYTAISIAVSNNDNVTAGLQIFISVAATLFYFSLLYVTTWENGAKDAIRIESGKMEPMPHKGLLLALLANVPNFLLCGLAIIFMTAFIAGGASWLEQAFGILNLFFGFLESMFLGVVINIFPIVDGMAKESVDLVYLFRTIAYFVAPLLSIGVTAFAYIMGSKNKRIFGARNAKGSQANRE